MPGGDTWDHVIRSHHFMASGETVETVTDFIFLGSEITEDGYCSHEIKRCLLLRRKAMTNLDSILKSRDITLPTNVYIVKAMIFPVVMYGCEGWTTKKAECWRTDAFEFWCWRVSWLLTLLLLNFGVGGISRVSWESLGQQGDQTSQSKRKSVLNIHWKDWCWSSNTLATWCEELTYWKRPWC